jgi:hypothetical protein
MGNAAVTGEVLAKAGKRFAASPSANDFMNAKPSDPVQAALFYALVIAYGSKIEPSLEWLAEWSALPRHIVEAQMLRLSSRSGEQIVIGDVHG